MNIQNKIAHWAWHITCRLEISARDWLHHPLQFKRITCDACGKNKWSFRRRNLVAPDNSDMEVCAKCYNDIPF